MGQGFFADVVGEQPALEVYAHDARQLGVTHLAIQARPGSSIRQLAPTLGFATILRVELADPSCGLALKRLNLQVAPGCSLGRYLRVMRDDQAQPIPRRLAQHLLLCIGAKRPMQRLQYFGKVAVAPARNG